MQFLPGRLGNDVDAALERVAFVEQYQVGACLWTEEFLEHVAEVHPDLLEGFAEHLAGVAIDPVDHAEELFLGVLEILHLLEVETVGLFQLFELLDRVEIDRSHRIEPGAEFADDFANEFPVGTGCDGRVHIDLGVAFILGFGKFDDVPG